MSGTRINRFSVPALLLVGFLVGSVFTSGSVPFGAAPNAYATHNPYPPTGHVWGNYPNTGYLWLDRLKYGPTLYQRSDRCKAEEDTYRASFDSQLRGADDGVPGQFRGAWPYGIHMMEYGPCPTTSVDNSTDIMFDYMTATEWTNNGHGAYGGHVHSTLGSSSWCAYWGFTYKCGYHISRIHLNEPRIATYSAAYKTKFYLHETSHSMGFRDYCGHTSVANNGADCAITSGYNTLDRQMIRDYIYKNSPVSWTN